MSWLTVKVTLVTKKSNSIFLCKTLCPHSGLFFMAQAPSGAEEDGLKNMKAGFWNSLKIFVFVLHMNGNFIHINIHTDHDVEG